MNLFEINQEIASCVKLESGDFVNTETGEIIDKEALDSLKMEKNTKIRNIACWIRNLQSDENQLDEQEKIYRNRKNAVKRKREDLEAYLASVLNGEGWKNKEVEVKWRKSEVVVVSDEKKLSSYYFRFKEPEVNKTLLKADLKAGIRLNGCELVTKNNMSVK